MENPSFYLEGVVREKNELQDFEGPLSLILMLLSKNKIEIRDIRIGDILDQYLEYLDKMESMDLEIASEFVQMASHLLYIKTRTLLAGEEEEVSELELLMASLEQLKCKDTFAALQKIIPELRSASELGLLYFQKLPEPPPAEREEYLYRHEPVELLEALGQVFSRGSSPKPTEELVKAVPQRVVYSVRDKSRELLDRLRAGSLTLSGIYRGCRSRSEVVATFLSVLELCSMGIVTVTRSEEESEYLVHFVGGDVEEIMEKIVE